MSTFTKIIKKSNKAIKHKKILLVCLLSSFLSLAFAGEKDKSPANKVITHKDPVEEFIKKQNLDLEKIQKIDVNLLTIY